MPLMRQMGENMTQETNQKSKALKVVLAVAVVLVIIAGMLFLYSKFSPKPVVGAKAITVDVVDDAGTLTEYSLNTDAEFLKQALEEIEDLEIIGEDSDYGFMVTAVNGLQAVYDVDGAYWSFYVNDTYCEYGVDAQPVYDGDAFKIEYTLAE